MKPITLAEALWLKQFTKRYDRRISPVILGWMNSCGYEDAQAEAAEKEFRFKLWVREQMVEFRRLSEKGVGE